MIFVTGGTGLVGRHVLLELRGRGEPTLALVRDEKGAAAVRALGATPVRGRVEDPGLWSQVDDVSAIVHAAAMVTTRAAWSEYEAVNVTSVRLAAERARQLGVPVIHISSVAVYGREGYLGTAESVDEDFPLGGTEGESFYPRSKRLGEAALWEEAGRGARAIALRPCVIYGEGDRQFLPRVVRLARSGWLPLLGGEHKAMALVHARHVAQAAAQALALDRGWGRAFNLVDPEPLSAPELIEAVGEGLGRRVRPLPLPGPLVDAGAWVADELFQRLIPGGYPTRASGAIRFWRGANPYKATAATRELQWRPSITPRQGVVDAVRAIVSN
jgi:nucleoside-diphosphate-sugar epimerase